MTKLSEEQVELLEQVAQTKERVDKHIARLTEAHKVALYDAEAPLRQVVLDAALATIPIRQIGISGLGTKDYATVRRLLPVQMDGVAEIPPPRAQSVVKGKPGIETVSENLYVVTDVHGEEWEFWTIDFDGNLVVERSNNLKKGNLDKTVPFEVMNALIAKFPGADFESIDAV